MIKLKGLKRSLLILMLVAVPLVSAEPISVLQEIPRPHKTVSITTGRIPVSRQTTLYGIASWYSETDPFINLHTANGEIFDDSQLTCASWDYPFGTRLRVENLENGKSVICRVNDRGPAKRLNRMVDLTLGAFEKIAAPRLGLLQVSVTRIVEE